MGGGGHMNFHVASWGFSFNFDFPVGGGGGHFTYAYFFHLKCYLRKNPANMHIWVPYGSATGLRIGPIWVIPNAFWPDGSHMGPT